MDWSAAAIFSGIVQLQKKLRHVLLNNTQKNEEKSREGASSPGRGKQLSRRTIIDIDRQKENEFVCLPTTILFVVVSSLPSSVG